MPMPAPMTVRPNPMPAPMYASAISMSSLLRRISVMSVSGHADEHGREQREDVCLDQDHDELERSEADADRQRHRHPDADAGDGVSKHLREDEDQRQQREDRDMPAHHVARESHGQCERP